MRRTLLSLILFAVSCASTRASRDAQAPYVPDPSKASEASTVVVCENEMPTGSNIAETRCRRVEDIDADRRHAQDMMEEGPQRSAPPISH